MAIYHRGYCSSLFFWQVTLGFFNLAHTFSPSRDCMCTHFLWLKRGVTIFQRWHLTTVATGSGGVCFSLHTLSHLKQFIANVHGSDLQVQGNLFFHLYHAVTNIPASIKMMQNKFTSNSIGSVHRLPNKMNG